MHKAMLDRLAATPGFLLAVAANGQPDQFKVRPTGHVFALAEHIWHLRDYEVEAVTGRIESILSEETPVVEEFDGDAIAKRRNYLQLDWAPALEEFRHARAANLAKLSDLSPESWRRGALFHGFGPITLLDLARITADHDSDHIREILALGQGCSIWTTAVAA